ncbi:MAG: sulfur reduction protein DsrJ [Sedimenticolaceae bacterium]
MKGNFGFGLLFAALLGMVVGLGTAHAGEGMAGTAKADKLDVCVEPTDVMRRRHFDFIKHQRDITVHEGIRKTDHSLAGCVDCHVRTDAKGEHVPINAAGEFCAACHEYTGATLDCFSCHATKPTGTRE